MSIMSGKSKKSFGTTKSAKSSSKGKSKIKDRAVKTTSTKGGRKVGGAVAHLVADEEMDIKKPLFPLVHYVNDRNQFTDEIFRTMSKQGRLDAMLPDILKDLPVSELKRLCVQQLEVMSKKRIRSILAGVEMDSSSGTEDSGNELEKGSDDVATSNPQAADSTGLDVTEDDNACNQVEPIEGTLSEGEYSEPNSPEAKDLDMMELHPEMDADDNLFEDSVDRPAGMDVLPDLSEAMEDLTDGSATIARTYLEILELEMRARAIKSLLNSQPTQPDAE